MSRRILHVIDSLSRTGTARQLQLLSHSLAEAGWDVHVATLRGAGRWPARLSPPESTAAKISLTALGGHWSVDPLAQLRLARLVGRLQPDVIHTWDLLPSLVGLLTLRTRDERRIIAGQYHIDRQFPGWEWPIYRRLARHVERIATNSTTVSEWLKSNGLPADKLMVIRPGVPLSPSPVLRGGARGGAAEVIDSRIALLNGLHLPPDARLIGVIGGLVPDKRVKDLIWAADLLRVLHDNLRVLIIGDGPQREQLERYARLASDLEHIQFLGERSDVDRIMPHLDVLWNGSENTGPSIAILEAMAAGVPVVASDTPSNRDLIIENETGYLIPLGSRAGRAARARVTNRLFADTQHSSRLADNSRREAHKLYTLDTMSKQHDALYARSL